MLYYIIPPIIIILSLSVLIFFLFRKVSQLPDGVVLVEEKPVVKVSRWSAIFSAMGHFGLKMLERLMQRMKLFSLKFHNASNDWFHSIKKKREEQKAKHEQQNKLLAEKLEGESEMQSKVREKTMPDSSEVQPKIVIASQTEAPMISRRARVLADSFQMVSKKVTRPESKNVVTKAKSKLEDALIKRIAINPRDIEAYERLGDYYLEQDNMSDALECYRQVLRLSPVHYKAKSKIRRIERILGK